MNNSFPSYPWQQSVWQEMTKSYRQNRLPHALLLAGSNGLGKQSFAKEFAQYVLCSNENKENNNQPCHQCTSCRLFLANTHPDLFNIFPEENSKIIKVEQIRQITSALNQTSHRVGYQIVILSPAESLNKEAANALLKTLEEPNGPVIVLLVSHQPGLLPITILSRCQKILFTAYPLMLTANWLDSQLKHQEISADTQLLLRSAGYAPLQALHLVDQHYLEIRDQLLIHLITTISQQTNPIASVTEFLKIDLAICLQAFFSLILDLFRLQLKVNSMFLVNQDRISILKKLAQNYSLAGISRILDLLMLMRQNLLNHAPVNIQLFLENLFINWKENAYAVG